MRRWRRWRGMQGHRDEEGHGETQKRKLETGGPGKARNKGDWCRGRSRR